MRSSLRVMIVAVIAACRGAAPEPTAPAPAPAPPKPTPDAALPAPDAAPTPDAAPLPSPPTRADACVTDDDCVVTNFAGCCTCPQCAIAPPHAISKLGEQQAEGICAVASCAAGMCGIAGMCPPGEPAAHFVARCRDHACAMERRKK